MVVNQVLDVHIALVWILHLLLLVQIVFILLVKLHALVDRLIVELPIADGILLSFEVSFVEDVQHLDGVPNVTVKLGLLVVVSDQGLNLGNHL